MFDSRPSRDQGYFFEDKDHAIPEPKTEEDILAGRIDEPVVPTGQRDNAHPTD